MVTENSGDLIPAGTDPLNPMITSWLKEGQQLPGGEGAAPQVEAGGLSPESRLRREEGGMARGLFPAFRSQSTGWPGTGIMESPFLGIFFMACFHPFSWSPDALAPGDLPPPLTSLSAPHHITLWGSCPSLHLPAPGLCQAPSFLANLGTKQVACFLLKCLGVCVPGPSFLGGSGAP